MGMPKPRTPGTAQSPGSGISTDMLRSSSWAVDMAWARFRTGPDGTSLACSAATASSTVRAATQALAGDPSKMVISRAEEHADLGVTIGAIFAGMLSLAITCYGGVLLLGQELPAVAAMLGISNERFVQLFSSAPLWIVGIGAAMSYFIFYILVKRAARHDLKRQRAQEIARLRIAE